jgi:two-component system, chemotaxis family, response regulator PixG
MTTASTQEITRANNISFKELIAQFKAIKTKSFTGNSIVRIDAAPSWMFTFSSGRVVSVSGGIDAVNRWQRNLGIICLDLPLDRLVRTNVQGEIFLNSNTLAQKSVIAEVLFDIIQLSQANGDRLNFQLIPINTRSSIADSSLPLLDIEPILSTAIKDWREWLGHEFAKYFPSQFLCVGELVPTTEHELQRVVGTIDGNRSLRSLAIHHQQHLIDFTKSLLPLLQAESIVLAAQPKSTVDRIKNHQTNNRVHQQIETIGTDEEPQKLERLNIACIDDSLLIYRHLEDILTTNGYRSYGVQDPLKIMPSLIKTKPDFIFLDLLMPITNGYEVCEQIRKTPSLKNIPVVILTGKDGLIDRMRAKIVGADGFLSKPVQTKSVLKAIERHLTSRNQVASKSWLN